MVNEIICVIRKDTKEYIRSRKNVYFALALLAIGAFVLLTTMFFPSLISMLSDKAPEMITDTKSLDSMMSNLFPTDVRGSLGIWASDVAIFYGIVVILMTQGLIRKEIRSGKWIMPVASGYSKKTLLIAKCVVYGAGAAFPVFILSNVFYFASSSILENNVGFSEVLTASVVLSITMAGIAVITILTSVLYRHSITAGLSMILIVMAAPDVMTFFAFGKYLPTYLLTYVYSMSNNLTDLIIPLFELIFIVLALFAVSSRKISTMELSR